MKRTANQISEVQDALIAHGFKFIQSSAELLGTDELFSIVHFAIGLELILKARLFQEHWSLVVACPHAAQWEGIKDGSFKSIQANEIVDCLERVLGSGLHSEKKVFKDIFSHRNKAIHFAPPASSAADIAAKQCRGWYTLHKLLVQTWHSEFDKYSVQIKDLNEIMLGHRGYLQVRFDELTNRSKFVSAKNAGTLMSCQACGFAAAIRQEEPAPHLQVASCLVCGASLTAASFDCGTWHDISDGLWEEINCECGARHTAEGLAALCDESIENPTNSWHQGGTKYNCGRCRGSKVVVLIDTKLQCMRCLGEFELEDRHECGYCGEFWVEYDCSSTDLTCCEFCDGPEWEE